MNETTFSIPFYAIDSTGTRDRDDALGYDGEHFYVAIADVSVPDDVLLELAARPETRYLPSRHVPMLPGNMEEQKSLRPGRQKAFVLKMTLDGTLLSISQEWVRVVILNYQEAAQTRLPDLLAMREIASQRRRQEYDFQGGWANIEGSVRTLSKKECNDGFVLVMELMVLTNLAVARYMQANAIPGLFRNHGVAPGERALYGLIATGHAGLDLPLYTHVTSPLRRLADLLTWRNLRAYLHKEEYLPLETLCEKVNAYYAIQQQKDSEQFKAWAIQATKEQLENETITQTARHKDFMNFLRSEPPLTPQLQAAIMQRADERLLTVKEAARILLRQHRMGVELTTADLDFISILTHAQQCGDIPEVEAEFNTPSFICTLTSGGLRVQGEGASKQEAQKNAAKELVAQLSLHGSEQVEAI